MKHFTTSIPMDDGRARLPIQVEGVGRGQLVSCLVGQRIIEISIPEQNSLEMTWFARLVLASGAAVDISGSSTEVGGWVEYGTVNVQLVPVLAPIEGRWTSFACDNVVITSISLLAVNQGGYEIEAGLVVGVEGGQEFRIVAGEVPGSFSLLLPDGRGKLVPQFSPLEYRNVLISEI